MDNDRKTVSVGDYSTSSARILGGIQLFLGVLCVVLNIIGLVKHWRYYFYISHGIICGAFFCLAGCFGVAAAYKKSDKLIGLFTVLSIPCAALLAPAVIVIEAIFLTKAKELFTNIPQEAMALHVSLFGLAFLELIVAFGASLAYNCNIIHCNNEPSLSSSKAQVFSFETPSSSVLRLLPSSDTSMSNVSMQYSIANPYGGTRAPLHGHGAMYLMNSSTSTLSTYI